MQKYAATAAQACRGSLDVAWLLAGAFEGLRSLLELPVEVVLPAHGAPGDIAALERALS